MGGRVQALARAVRASAAHQVHDRVDLVVTVQDVHQQLVQLSHVGDREVLGFADPLSEVAEDVRFGE